jgi:hypothetical protein
MLPHTAGVADKLCFVRSMHTEAINHDPAITFCQTGHQQPGRPSLGSWLSYGLGSGNRDLPAFMVMTPTWTGRGDAQALYSRLWGTGFLPSEHQGVALRAQGDPVLYLSNPAGLDSAGRRRQLDAIEALNAKHARETGDPEVLARMAQYEMSFRMQATVPELIDLSSEPAHVKDLYGPDVEKPGTFANCTLLARRMAERGVRFIQLYHRGWDHHGGLDKYMKICCGHTDKATWALLTDLKQRGLLEDTLVVWGGEFGRTPMFQGKGGAGRDHHIKGFSMWMAGGGVKSGVSYGETDELGYNAVKDVVHVRDFHATLLHLLGIDHHRFSKKFQGLDMRLTGVEPAKVIKGILA